MTRPSILVVEDEKPIRDMVTFGLRRNGFGVSEAQSCSEAFEQLQKAMPDLVLVDWMLPDSSGLELTRSLRRDPTYRNLPVIMLTARASEDDKVDGLRSGADDYMTKPFSHRELQARIDAVLRRLKPETSDARLVCGGLLLDPTSHRVTADGVSLALGPTEFRLLKFLMSHPERVYSRPQLLDRVWGQNVYVEERTVDAHVTRLRKVLAVAGYDKNVQTVRGAGYRFSEAPGQ
ncbi:MAG: phosphate regulon transcriptional regulator PhoB [Gammaproteobacteria bacterium]|nr:phosphate regulon transcriptional regulator PhoB [Gammaproteobacteria bacterium]